MIRRGLQALALGLLVVTAGPWALAATAPWWSRATYEPTGLEIAIAQQDGWLVTAQISRHGIVRVRQFNENLTHDRWFSMRASAPSPYGYEQKPGSVFTLSRTTETRSRSLWFHMLPVVTVAAVLTLFAFGLPWWRKRRRMKRGLCLRCAYDLRRATTSVCPECGMENPRVTIRNAL